MNAFARWSLPGGATPQREHVRDVNAPIGPTGDFFYVVEAARRRSNELRQGHNKPRSVPRGLGSDL